MIPSKVFAVRLFRVRRQKWLGGILRSIELSGRECRISFERFAEISHHGDLVDPYNPSEELYEDFHLVEGEITSGGVHGNDQRNLVFTEPFRVECGILSSDTILSIRSIEHGSAIVSAREKDITTIQQLLDRKPVGVTH